MSEGRLVKGEGQYFGPSQHSFSPTERPQIQLPDQNVLWAGLSSAGIQASLWPDSTTDLNFTWFTGSTAYGNYMT